MGGCFVSKEYLSLSGTITLIKANDLYSSCRCNTPKGDYSDREDTKALSLGSASQHDRTGPHLIKWEIVIEARNMRIFEMAVINRALSAKWPWRFSIEVHAL